jgi:hypothetical protein
MNLDNPTKDFDITDNVLAKRERHGSAVYASLRVNLDELPAIIQGLKSYGTG